MQLLTNGSPNTRIPHTVVTVQMLPENQERSSDYLVACTLARVDPAVNVGKVPT